jgi:carbon monoxide dehydrogenase subunit G
MPRGSFSHRIDVPAPASEVWERFQEPRTWQGIGPIDEIRDVEVDGDRLVAFTWSTHVGPSRYRGRSTIVENVPGKRVVMRLDSTEMGGALAVDLLDDSGATSVDVSLQVVTRGPMSSLFFPIISEAITRGLPAQVDAFAASFG